MVELVGQMLALQRQLAATRTAPERTALERQIDLLVLVYELYGLTEERIRIVGEEAETE